MHDSICPPYKLYYNHVFKITPAPKKNQTPHNSFQCLCNICKALIYLYRPELEMNWSRTSCMHHRMS